MKKKAGSFFKNVLSKGKNIFKKDDKTSNENGESNYDSEEDTDIIEVGKTGQGQSKKIQSQLLANISDFAGSTLQAADSYLHGGSTSAINDNEKSEITRICDRLSIHIDADRGQRLSSGDVGPNYEESKETDEDKLAEMFETYESSQFMIRSFQKQEGQLREEDLSSDGSHGRSLKCIDFIVMVGFHHKVGSQVEFIYPPLHEDKDGNMSAEFLKQIPLLALPDGSHLTEGGYVNFILRDQKNFYHCISCYRQIPASQLPQEDSISRAFVQKAVVVLTKVPLYGELRAKLQPTTEALFAQKNFKDTKILSDLYDHANSFNKGGIVKDYAQFYTGLNLRPVILLSNMNVLTLLKTIMLEGRIIIYSSVSSKVSNFLYALLSLLPGAISFKYHHSDQVLNYMRAQKQFGFPLQVFNSHTEFLPLFTLNDIEMFDRAKGYLIGTTNQLFLNFNKAKADIVINLDNDKLDFPNEKQGSSIIKITRSHSTIEKKMMGRIVKCLDPVIEETKVSSKSAHSKMMMKQDSSETAVFMNVNEEEQFQIRNEIKQYFIQLVVQMALAKKIVSDFYSKYSNSGKSSGQKQHNGRGKHSSESEDSFEDIGGFGDESTVILSNIEVDGSSPTKILAEEVSAVNPPQLEEVKQDLNIEQTPDQKQSNKSAKKAESKKNASKSKGSEKLEAFEEHLNKVSESKNDAISKIKKANTLKKKAVKSVLGSYQGFNLKFILAWSQTFNFRQWLSLVDQSVSALSLQAGNVTSATHQYENGDIYIGSFSGGVRHGVGSLYENGSGLTFNGEWVEDIRHGNGTLSSADQSYVFDGEWVNGMRQGKGQLITVKEKYSGLWHRDKYHKNGVLVREDGSVYEGDWVLGSMEGMGQLKLANGDFYIGEFARNAFNGKGQLKYGRDGVETGELYNGQFKDGKRHGVGYFVSADQSHFYDGQWIDDERNGTGTLILQNKLEGLTREVQGLWLNNEMDFDQPVTMTVKDKQGKVLSTYQGKVDKDFNHLY